MPIPVYIYYIVYVVFLIACFLGVRLTLTYKDRLSSTKLLFIATDLFLLIPVLKTNAYFAAYSRGFIQCVLFVLAIYFFIRGLKQQK